MSHRVVALLVALLALAAAAPPRTKATLANLGLDEHALPPRAAFAPFSPVLLTPAAADLHCAGHSSASVIADAGAADVLVRCEAGTLAGREAWLGRDAVVPPFVLRSAEGPTLASPSEVAADEALPLPPMATMTQLEGDVAALRHVVLSLQVEVQRLAQLQMHSQAELKAHAHSQVQWRLEQQQELLQLQAQLKAQQASPQPTHAPAQTPLGAGLPLLALASLCFVLACAPMARAGARGGEGKAVVVLAAEGDAGDEDDDE